MSNMTYFEKQSGAIDGKGVRHLCCLIQDAKDSTIYNMIGLPEAQMNLLTEKLVFFRYENNIPVFNIS